MLVVSDGNSIVLACYLLAHDDAGEKLLQVVVMIATQRDFEDMHSFATGLMKTFF